jgi:hypothetical protein
MRARALPTTLLLVAAWWSITAGAYAASVALPTDERARSHAVSPTQVADAEVVTASRRATRTLGRWVELLAPPTVAIALGAALLAVAGVASAQARPRRLGRARQYLSWSLRSPPRFSVDTLAPAG